MMSQCAGSHPISRIAGFIDIEASGIHPDSYPLMVSVCRLDGEPAYEAMIRPAAHWTHWCYDAQDLHGIERQAIIDDGEPPAMVAEALNKAFDGGILLCDSNQDGFWIEVLYEAVNFDPSFQVINACNAVPPGLLSAFLGPFPSAKAHRPMSDAIALRNAWYASGAGNIWDQNGG